MKLYFSVKVALLIAIWIGRTFIKLGLYHYVFVLNTSQWLNHSDYKPLALPYGLLVTIFGIWVAPNLLEQAHHFKVTTAFVLTTVLYCHTCYPAIDCFTPKQKSAEGRKLRSFTIRHTFG